nr:MAG TPA: hypothetical protein [Caudoviricetes sp.]
MKHHSYSGAVKKWFYSIRNAHIYIINKMFRIIPHTSKKSF